MGDVRIRLHHYSLPSSDDGLPTQISLELHANTMDASGYYSHSGRRLTTLGELAMLATLWHTRGYVLVSKEDNRLAARIDQTATGTELTLLRVRCPAATTTATVPAPTPPPSLHPPPPSTSSDDEPLLVESAGETAATDNTIV